jgi:pimeloyl-ACP methyl ester carboxylesterase
MSLPMPELEGAEHAFYDLPTGVRVHVASCGPADAPPVLALHGWPQHWWCWRDVIRELGDGFRVIAPDMRGFGWSDWPRDGDFGKQRVADDALALLDVLGLDRVCLVGHDWGGWCAILAALTAPERFSSLLALGIGHPWVPRAVAARNAYRLWYQVPLYLPAVTRDGHFPRKVLESARRDDAGWASGEVETYVAAVRESARATSRLYRSFPGEATARRPALRVPARLMIGAREPLGRYVAEGFPGEVEIVDGAGHFLPEEAPGLVARCIRELCG